MAFEQTYRKLQREQKQSKRTLCDYVTTSAQSVTRHGSGVRNKENHRKMKTLKWFCSVQHVEIVIAFGEHKIANTSTGLKPSTPSSWRST